MSLGNKFDESENKLSPSPTGEQSRIEFSRQPGKSTARLFEISPRIMLRATTPPTHGR